MATHSIPISRLASLLAAFIALGAGAAGGELRATADPDPAAFATLPSELEDRIESLIEGWFSILENAAVEATTLNGLLAEPPFELVLDGETLLDPASLLAWVSRLRASYPQIEYRLDSIRIEAQGSDLYRASFEFDRHALDAAGLSHVGRREQSWIIRSGSDAKALILRIEERPLLFFPGTGPQIVCY